MTLSDGVQAPKRVRSLSRKKRLALGKEHQRIQERECGYPHELTRKLVAERSAKFYVEDLRVPNLVKNHHLARAIIEQQWGAFFDMLTYKAESAGGWVHEVNPRHTSQRCSGCGAMPDQRLTLGDRTYVCLTCRLVVERA